MEIRIKDKRSGRFVVDNYILDEYGGRIGATGIALYVALCRWANNDTQQCWPSLETLHTVTGMKRNTIIDAGKLLVEFGLVKKEVIPGKWAIYTLLEPTSTEKGTTNQYPKSHDQYPNGYYTSTQKGTQTNLENELIKQTKERTKANDEIYNQKLVKNEHGLPSFATT